KAWIGFRIFAARSDDCGSRIADWGLADAGFELVPQFAFRTPQCLPVVIPSEARDLTSRMVGSYRRRGSHRRSFDAPHSLSDQPVFERFLAPLGMTRFGSF